jgi:tellurite resistance protein TehA-like permease
MLLQVYTAWYLTPVAVTVVAVTAMQAREAVRARRPQRVRDGAR